MNACAVKDAVAGAVASPPTQQPRFDEIVVVFVFGGMPVGICILWLKFEWGVFGVFLGVLKKPGRARTTSRVGVTSQGEKREGEKISFNALTALSAPNADPVAVAEAEEGK